jgi:hypothetical protein
MRALVFILVVASLGLTGAPARAAGDARDLEEYLQQIRAWGMSESAHGALLMVAGIVNGYTLLSYSRDSTTGHWVRGYRSTACPLPRADSLALARWQSEIGEKNAPVVELLRGSADRDYSGFVTTEEGRAFRDLVELGYFVDYLQTKESLGSEEVAKATNLTVQRLMDRAEAYNDVARRFNAGSAKRIPILEIVPGGKLR